MTNKRNNSMGQVAIVGNENLDVNNNFKVLEEWARLTPPLDRHLSSTFNGSPRRSTLQFDNILGQTVAPTVGTANHDGTTVIHRPFFARSRSTIPPTVPWYQSLHGLPEVGGAHRTRPLLPEKNRNDFVSNTDSWSKWKTAEEKDDLSKDQIAIVRKVRQKTPLLGPKGVRGLREMVGATPLDVGGMNVIVGPSDHPAGGNAGLRPAAPPPIFPSTHSAMHVDSRIWRHAAPQQAAAPSPSHGEGPDSTLPDLQPHNTFQALLHSYPHGLLSEDRHKRSAMSLSPTVEAQRFTFTSRTVRADRDSRLLVDGNAAYESARADAASIHARLRRGAGDPVAWRTPGPTPRRRTGARALAAAHLVELEESGASPARYGAHALHPPRAAAVTRAGPAVATPAWMPPAAQCCRASCMAAADEYGATPFVRLAAAHAKRVEIESQIVALQDRLRALTEADGAALASGGARGEGLGPDAAPPFGADAARRREADAASAQHQLGLAKEALTLVREQARLIRTLSRPGPSPPPHTAATAASALNTPSWPAGSLDPESRVRLAGMSKPELLLVLAAAGTTNTVFGNEPLARLDRVRLATLVASNARARAVFLRRAGAVAPRQEGSAAAARHVPTARCASELAGWLVAFDRGGRLQPPWPGEEAAARRRGGRSVRARTARSLSPTAAEDGPVWMGGGGDVGADRGVRPVGAQRGLPTDLDQAIFHSAL